LDLKAHKKKWRTTLKEDTKKVSPKKNESKKAPRATWELLLLASFSSCSPLIREYFKLGNQATFAT